MTTNREDDAMALCEKSYRAWNGTGPSTHDDCESCAVIAAALREKDEQLEVLRKEAEDHVRAWNQQATRAEAAESHLAEVMKPVGDEVVDKALLILEEGDGELTPATGKALARAYRQSQARVRELEDVLRCAYNESRPSDWSEITQKMVAEVLRAPSQDGGTR